MEVTDSESGEVPSLVTRIGRRGRRDLVRATSNPFTSRADRSVIVHCAHHKAGTVWLQQVLFFSLVRPYGLRMQLGRIESVRPGTDFVLYTRAEEFRRRHFAPRSYRGSHMVRDPRDMVVSGYEYHKRTEEQWAHAPRPQYGGLSYQAYLSSMNEHDGLLAEIERFANRDGAKQMGGWNYDRPEFLELRYEDALADQRGTFEKLFRWYRLNEKAIDNGLEIVDQLSLERGGAVPGHARSGRQGEWHERFGPGHIERFKELTGDLVVRLGYESTPDW